MGTKCRYVQRHRGLLAVTTKLINRPLPIVHGYVLRRVVYISLLISGIGDTKAGTLIATDRYGNKYFENLAEELPCERPNARLSKAFVLTYR